MYSTTILENITVHSTNGSIIKSNIIIKKNGTTALYPPSKTLKPGYVKKDLTGHHLMMGAWIDTHIHGYGGIDFSAPDLTVAGIAAMTAKLADIGLAGLMATTVTMRLPQLRTQLRIIDEYVQTQDLLGFGHAKILGVHLEGPFLSSHCKGAHDATILKEIAETGITLGMFESLLDVAPHVKEWKMTFSPDLDGSIPGSALEFIAQIKPLEERRNISVKIYLGHTNAAEEIIEAALAAGAAGFTHFGNANCEQVHRKEKKEDIEGHLHSHVAKATSRYLKERPDAKLGIELITDGHHLSPAFIAWTMEFATKQAVLVTDALGPSGLEDGRYPLGSIEVEKTGRCFYLADDPTKLAGSACNYAELVESFYDICLKADLADPMALLFQVSMLNPPKYSFSREKQCILLQEAQALRSFVILNAQAELVMSKCWGEPIKNYGTEITLRKARSLGTGVLRPEPAAATALVFNLNPPPDESPASVRANLKRPRDSSDSSSSTYED